MTIGDELFYPDWQLVLMGVDGLTMSEYAYQYKKTYAYTHKMVEVMLKLGLCSAEKVGRTRKISLTDKGKELSESLLRARSIVTEMKKARG